VGTKQKKINIKKFTANVFNENALIFTIFAIDLHVENKKVS